MSDDSSAWLENALGKGSGSDAPDLSDARCPKCGASDFVAISDLYTESVIRREDGSEPSSAPRAGGMTDAQILKAFAPPSRKSALVPTVAVALPLAAASYYVYGRYGGDVGQPAAIATAILTVVTLLTRLRANSDKYYHARQTWNRTFMCRKCGQRVAG